MKKAIFAVLLLLATTGRAGAQVDSCLCIWGAADSSGWINPDTVMVDTCKSHMGFPPSSNEYVYSKRYVVGFNYAVIKLNAVSPDSTLIVPWTSVDSIDIEFKNICKNVAAKYDGLWFMKVFPSVGDSTDPRYNNFLAIIGKYAQVDSIIDTLWPQSLLSIIEVVGFNRPGPATIDVKPIPKPEPLKLIFLDATHVQPDGITSITPYIISDDIGRTVARNSIDPNESIDLSLLPQDLYFFSFEGTVNQSFKALR